MPSVRIYHYYRTLKKKELIRLLLDKDGEIFRLNQEIQDLLDIRSDYYALRDELHNQAIRDAYDGDIAT